MYCLHDVRMKFLMSLAMTITAERHEVADNILALATASDVMNIHGLFAAHFTRYEVIYAEAEMPEVNLCVRGHSFARNLENSSSMAAMIRSLVSLSGYSTWITSP